MKKKIALMLSLLAVLATVLCGCGTDPKTVDYNGYTYDELLSTAQLDIQYVQGLAEDLNDNGLTADDLYNHNYSAIYDYLISAGITDEQIEATTAWNEVADEFGTVTSVDTDSFSVDKAGSTLTTDIQLLFTADDGSTKDVTFEVVYDYYSMEVTGISINPVYSMGEKMSKAALNTVISISVVFFVLILISLIIYSFNIFPYLEKRKKEKAQAASAANSPAPADFSTQIELREEQQPETVDDTELIAVISAAIAASEGTSTSGFVVRSINRR
jgi:hypothetical protein